MLKRQPRRHGQNVHFRSKHVFGAAAIAAVAEERVFTALVVFSRCACRALAARDAGSEDHFVAGVDALGGRANGRDFAGNIAARDERKRKCDPVQSPADPQVEMVQAAGAHVHDDFIRPRVGFGDLRELQDFRPAVFGDDNCPHCPDLRRCGFRNVEEREAG